MRILKISLFSKYPTTPANGAGGQLAGLHKLGHMLTVCSLLSCYAAEKGEF